MSASRGRYLLFLSWGETLIFQDRTWRDMLAVVVVVVVALVASWLMDHWGETDTRRRTHHMVGGTHAMLQTAAAVAYPLPNRSQSDRRRVHSVACGSWDTELSTCGSDRQLLRFVALHCYSVTRMRRWTEAGSTGLTPREPDQTKA